MRISFIAFVRIFAFFTALFATACGDPEPSGPDGGGIDADTDAPSVSACAKWNWMDDPAMWDCFRLEPANRQVPAGQCDILLSEQDGQCSARCTEWFWGLESQIVADQASGSFTFRPEPTSELGYTCNQRR